MTRNALARLVAALGGVVLLVALVLALNGQGSRLDILLLAIATIVQFVAVLAWWAASWTPRYVVIGYGLVLAASGLGFVVSAPAEASALLTFYGMGAAGILTVIAGVIHR